MDTGYHFASSAHWTGGPRGVVEGQGIEPPIDFAPPPEFHGQEGIWTPEHFLTAAVAACFITTFRAIASLSKFEAVALDVSAEGVVEKSEGGFRFTRVTVHPVLTIRNESDRERALRLLEKTEKACLVSRSLQSQVILDPRVVVVAAAARG